MISEQLKQHLIFLADKYENESFYEEDPSQILKWYSKTTELIPNIECAAFIGAMLSFGNRKQFIPKIKEILNHADKCSGDIINWILSNAPDFSESDKKFYRFYSYSDMKTLFRELKKIIIEKKSLGEYFKDKYKNSPSVDLDLLISESFPESKIVPKGKNSANKRIHMFLRWMVRNNSPVDLGLWNWYPKSRLLIPLDVHVIEESKKLGLLSEKDTASRKTAIYLTNELKNVFPEDPVRCDFSLFGLGVDNSK